MSYIFEIAPHILAELRAQISSGTPAISTERGDLYIHDRFYMGAINLKVSADDYLKFLEGVDEALRPPYTALIPQKDAGFDIYVNGVVTINDGKVFLNGKETMLL